MTITLDPPVIEQPASLPELPVAPLTVTEVLEAARGLISEPEKWIQGLYTEDNQRWCSVGAVRHICRLDAVNIDIASVDSQQNADLYVEALCLLSEAIHGRDASSTAGPDSIIYFNDRSHTRHADVLAVYDQAIAKSKELSSQ